MTKQLIGYETILHEDMKEAYKNPKYKKDDNYMVAVRVFYTKSSYKILVELLDWHYDWDKTWESIRKQTKNKAIPLTDNNKSVDTSKWVKPDEESLKRELITELILSHILKEGTHRHTTHFSRAEVLYSILNSHSPQNPQSLTNFAVERPFHIILGMLGSKYSKQYWNNFHKRFESKNYNHEKAVYEHHAWTAKMDKNIIQINYVELPKKRKQFYHKLQKRAVPSKERLEQITKEREKERKAQQRRIAKFDKIVQKAYKEHGRKNYGR